MPHNTASIFNPRSSPVKPSKLTAYNMKFVICQSNRLWSIQIKASHKMTEQHSKPSNNIITLGCIAYSLQTLQISNTSVIISKPKRQYSIIPYISNRRLKPKPPQNNVMAISKALKAVNDTMDWTVLFIVLLLVMVQQGTACRYPASLSTYSIFTIYLQFQIRRLFGYKCQCTEQS